MTEILEKAKSALSEESGKISSMRIAMIGVVYVALIVWAVFCGVEGKLIDMPGGVVGLVGVVVGSKAMQSIFERK